MFSKLLNKKKHPISIVMPYYNQADLLRFTLPIWRQIFPHDEIIIVDDGSDQKAADVVKSLGLNATVIYQSRNGYGCARALNLGWRSAHTDYIFFTDCDIIPNKIFYQAYYLSHLQILNFTRNECDSRNLPAILSSHNLKTAAKLCSIPDVRYKLGAISNIAKSHRLPLSPLYCYGFGLCIPKYMIAAVGGFNENIHCWGGEDLLLCMQIEDKFPKVFIEIETKKPVLHLETKEMAKKMSALNLYYQSFPDVAKKCLSSRLFYKYQLDKMGQSLL